MSYLLSIVVPTKNRYEYLKHLIELINDFDNKEIELVIQDNSDDNSEIIDFLKRINNDNIKYFYSTELLSQGGNSDKAILNSTGEYVCFIGDDDGVMPNIVEVTRWMKDNGYKAMKAYKPSYHWPGLPHNFLSNNCSGVVEFKKWKKGYKIMKTSVGLTDTLKKGGVSIKKLPCVYHGIVRKDILQVIYNKTGTYFPGPSPDMANAIALTQVIDDFVYVNYPVVISGKSPKSAGGLGVLHQHVSRIEDVSQLPQDTALHWDKRIPKYWTGPTIYAESVIKALQSFDNQAVIEKFNFNYLYAWVSVFNRRDSQIIFSNFEIKYPLHVLFIRIKIFLYRTKVFAHNRISPRVKISNVVNIKKAIEVYQKYIID